MLNSLVLRDSGVAGEGEDMPRGVALAVHVADALGRRVLDMVTYMEVGGGGGRGGGFARMFGKAYRMH